MTDNEKPRENLRMASKGHTISTAQNEWEEQSKEL